ncbi:hypothetical protein [Nostoc commune]|uniref:hypothetical protein n=1 Tax=Nostoc commune TaxID=1178 RepID=UPI0018C774D5|nr:hypothetical protein [Nostoc commune]MBG1257793.1 hypothetical protein [Nostoc commune BAE]
MVKTFGQMGKILTSLYNRLFEILIIQLLADFFHQKVTGFDNLSRIGHLVHLPGQTHLNIDESESEWDLA